MTEPSLVVTVLGFDFGTKRIGVAVGQSITGTATPLMNLNAKEGIPDWNQMTRLVNEWQPHVFVVGIPYNMDGSESEMSLRAKKFARRLQARFNRPAHGVDERLSSWEARGRLAALAKEDKQRLPLDSYAAVLIIEHWLTEQRTQK